jgi:ABC-2 type transport system ATP-binding protein/lipopolysaccharide transport system ATP-binding protein
MASISLKNVSVSFPVYDGSSRSLKNRILTNSVVGGRIDISERRQSVVVALQHVTAEFPHGSRIGLVGHNGAGKSTLLRVLAGIYEPCSGTAIIRGHAAPLFDIALGMDHEATGLENIRLRALYLGLSPRELNRLIPEIINFAELGQFIDLPVRTYSAGMRLRLAFAVSTAFEPEILLIDEGIAAGDGGFIERANKRLRSFTERASIIVLASHSISLIRSMCNHVIVMEHGCITATGEVDSTLGAYVNSLALNY